MRSIRVPNTPRETWRRSESSNNPSLVLLLEHTSLRGKEMLYYYYLLFYENISFIRMKPHPIRQHQKAEKNTKIKSEELLKEFEDFRNVKENIRKAAVPEPVESKLAQNDSLRGERIIDQLHQLITSGYKAVSPGPWETENVTQEEDSTETSTDQSPPLLPLSLTSDSHQPGGEEVQAGHFSEEDGTFVIVVVGITLCAIAAVVGVGCFIHKPTCPRSASPFSDYSPTFQSSKLAFSSSPDEKMNNNHHTAR